MQEMTIRLPEETVNYLQRLDYEIGGLQVLHTHALKAGTPLEKRMEIRREFQETFAEYQMAKNEMWAEYAPRFPGAVRWWVDFQTGELHIGGASAATSGRSPEANDARREPPSQQESPRPFGAPPFHKGGRIVI